MPGVATRHRPYRNILNFEANLLMCTFPSFHPVQLGQRLLPFCQSQHACLNSTVSHVLTGGIGFALHCSDSISPHNIPQPGEWVEGEPEDQPEETHTFLGTFLGAKCHYLYANKSS